MDITKAQYLLLKIQTFLELGHGNDLSRLEKDLMKSYIIQLYDAVSADDISSIEKSYNQFKPEPKKESKIQDMPTPARVEAKMPADSVTSTEKEVEVPAESPTYTPPEPEIAWPQKPLAPPSTKKEVPVTKPVETKGVASEELIKLFELSHPSEMDSRFSHVPIDDIASALGLNERIFTLNVLFGGDRELYESTCAQLNQLNSFSEATDILLGGPARKYNWADRESIKMAEHFIRTVARRYPQK
jgi:hypothetical protein